MAWFRRRIEHAILRLADNGLLRVERVDPVPCAACAGKGRIAALEHFRAMDVPADALPRIVEAMQGICPACGGAGVVVPRTVDRVTEQKVR